MKVMVVMNEAGKVVGAHIVSTPSREPRPGDFPPEIRLAAGGGQRLLELEVPEDAVMGRSPEEALRNLQGHKDAQASDGPEGS
jgi:hypothetical protein